MTLLSLLVVTMSCESRDSPVWLPLLRPAPVVYALRSLPSDEECRSRLPVVYSDSQIECEWTMKKPRQAGRGGRELPRYPRQICSDAILASPCA